MINLLPTNEKIRLSKSYQKRFFIALLSFSAGALFVGVIFLVTPYRLAKEKTVTVASNAGIVSSLAKGREISNPEFVMKDVQKRLNMLASKKSRRPPSVFIKSILNDRPDGISLIGFTYNQKSDGGESIEVRGTANDRDNLLRFARALEGETNFAKVVVPVSSFVKDKDLEFAIVISTKAPPQPPQP